MSTKRLERTVMEGGRVESTKFRRRYTHRAARAKERAYVQALRFDPALADCEVDLRREKSYRAFADKLGPASRWLYKRRGRAWREVEGEIRRLFDTRSISGQHIVFDHLLPGAHGYRSLDGWSVNGRFWFSVDDEGILRVENARWRRRPRTWVRQEMRDYFGDRKILRRGQTSFWLLPARTRVAHVAHGSHFRQGQRLRAHEVAFVEELNEAELENFVVVADEA